MAFYTSRKHKHKEKVIKLKSVHKLVGAPLIQLVHLTHKSLLSNKIPINNILIEYFNIIKKNNKRKKIMH